MSQVVTVKDSRGIRWKVNAAFAPLFIVFTIAPGGRYRNVKHFGQLTALSGTGSPHSGQL